MTLSQKRMALSSDPEASVLESGDHATADTPAMCPTSVSMCRPVDASHILMVPSAEAEAIHLPSGEMRTWEMGLRCPPRTRRGLKVGFVGCRGRGGSDATSMSASAAGVRKGVGSPETGERVRERETVGDLVLVLDLDLDLDLDLSLESERERERDLESEGDLDVKRDLERERDLDLLRDVSWSLEEKLWRRFGLGLLLADALSGWRSRIDTRREELSSFPSSASGASYRGVDSVRSSWRTLRRLEGGAATGTSATDVSSSAMLETRRESRYSPVERKGWFRLEECCRNWEDKAGSGTTKH